MSTILITSGGGAKGAFTVGALRHLSDIGTDQFDYILGTSSGALISTLAAIGDLDTLEQVYTSVNTNDIITRQNILRNFLADRPFIFDNHPLNKILDRVLEHRFRNIMDSPTNLCLNAVSLKTGRRTIFCTKDNIPHSRMYDKRLISSWAALKNALMASSNQAAFMPPIDIEQEQFVDGGNREVVPTALVPFIMPRPNKIIVLSNNPATIERRDEPFTSVLDVLFRAISIFLHEVRENDRTVLQHFKKEHTDCDIRIIEPLQDLDPQNPTGLRFEPNAMATMIGLGKLRAREVMELPADPDRIVDGAPVV